MTSVDDRTSAASRRTSITSVVCRTRNAFSIGIVFARSLNHWCCSGVPSGKNNVPNTGSGSLSSAQIYWLPKVRTGAVTSRATVKWKIPYHGSQPQKLSVSPLSVTMPLLGGLAGGMATELVAAEGARTDIGAGPELRLKLPGAALVLDALENVTGNAPGLRLSFASTF